MKIVLHIHIPTDYERGSVNVIGSILFAATYRAERPLISDVLLSHFEMFHWLLGWYTSYCAAPFVTGTSERKHNKIWRMSGRHVLYKVYSPLM